MRYRDPALRQRILASAIRAFNRYGAMVPVSVISTDAHVAAGTPFSYFRSKDEMLRSAYFFARESAADYMVDPSAGFDDPETLVKRIVISIIEWACACPDEYQYIVKYEDAFCFDYYSEEFKELFVGVVDDLQIWDLIRHDIRDDLPKAVVSRMISVQCGVFFRYIAHKGMQIGEARTTKFLETSADSIWKSICAIR